MAQANGEWWRPAQMPVAPPDDGSCEEVRDATLTPVTKGDLRTESPPLTWMTGAVHRADGTLVVDSQRRWNGELLAPVAADPSVITTRENVASLNGSWLYGGHWSRHFGHFLLEVLPNLWPEPDRVPADGALDGLLFHRSFRSDVPPAGPAYRPARLQPWHAEMLELAGYGDLPVLVAQQRRVRVERLVVPTRPVSLLQWARPEAVALWRRMAEHVPVATGGAGRLFLSRADFHRTTTGWHVRSAPEWDQQMEQEFATAGFTIVRPEHLPLREQIALVRSAEVIAGGSGSALHLSAFARPGTHVLEVGDTRSRGVAQPSQRLIDAACGHVTAYVDHADLGALRAVLGDLDVAGPSRARLRSTTPDH